MHTDSVNIMLVLSLSGAATGTSLFVSSYAGDITSLSLANTNGTYSLTTTGIYPECAPSPSWLTIDPNHGLLYCLNEGLQAPNGSLSLFNINDDGQLTHIQNTTTISGPVSGVIYGSSAGPHAIALAHYTGSALSTFNITTMGTFGLNEVFTYTLSQPGPNPSRQEAPHAHDAITDPTGQYVLVPDLGADLVRIYSWSPETLKLASLAPLQAASGSGPRHAAFSTPNGIACDGCTTYMYLVAELSSTVTAYVVTYLPNKGGLIFEQIYLSSTYGNTLQPPGNAPAEIRVTPDNRFVIISNRNTSDFVVPNPIMSKNASTYFPQEIYAGVNGSDKIPDMEVSDSISTFEISQGGTLTFIQLAPAGGSWPRSMSVSPDGSMLAVGLQYSSRVVIYERDIATGLRGQYLASAEFQGPGQMNVTSVVWGK